MFIYTRLILEYIFISCKILYKSCFGIIRFFYITWSKKRCISENII